MKKERSNSVMPSWSAFEEGYAPKENEATDNESAAVEDEFVYYFDPNDKRYRCCCQQSHSTTGVRIIAGLLCVTVFLELCQICWHSVSGNSVRASETAATASIGDASAVQVIVGAAIAVSVLFALWRENAALLLPYLLLQAIGLVAVFVILFALIYITLSNDLDTIRAFLNSHSPNVIDSYNQRYLIYMGWTMVGSCFVLLGLQWWLISVVFACWRYFRDKRNFGYAKGYNTSSFVIFRRVESAQKIKRGESVRNVDKLPKKKVGPMMSEALLRLQQTPKLQRIRQSLSLDESVSTIYARQSINEKNTQL